DFLLQIVASLPYKHFRKFPVVNSTKAIVILSEQGIAQSKEPLPARSGNGDARHSLTCSFGNIKKIPGRADASAGLHGVLRLAATRFARVHFAQDDISGGGWHVMHIRFR